MVRNHPPNVVTLRVGFVHGLYSEWSPSISTNRVKVLTSLKDHQLVIPEGCAIAPPTLGRVGEFDVSFMTMRALDKPTREVELSDDELPEGLVEKSESPGDEGLLLQRAALKLAVLQSQRLKYLSYAAWVVAALLALLVLRR
jgi:hypothetical protein